MLFSFPGNGMAIRKVGLVPCVVFSAAVSKNTFPYNRELTLSDEPVLSPFAL